MCLFRMGSSRWCAGRSVRENRSWWVHVVATAKPQLHALLGEAQLVSGSPAAPSRPIAFAPQESFIQSGTIRDNILFGSPYDPTRLHETLRQVSLLPDLETMPDGDLTHVGENGITLSGGQKARINLARAVYSSASTVLLDDILSAVDAQTAQHIVHQCLAGDLLRGRSVVLVTHQTELCLPVVHHVVRLLDGQIEYSGPPKRSKIVEKSAVAEGPASWTPRVDKRPPRQLNTTERREQGRVGTRHYLLILRLVGGYPFAIALVLAGILFRLLEVMYQFNLQHWSDDPNTQHLNHYISVGAGMLVALFIDGSMRQIIQEGFWGRWGFVNGMSRRVHDEVLDRVISAPLAFFESTPTGRLLSVFGRNVNVLDDRLSSDPGGVGGIRAS